jgi:signal transduction histidine kinase
MLPIRWRLTLFHALAILGIAALLIAFLVAALIRGVVKEVDETARARAAEAVRALETAALPNDAALAALTDGDVFLVVRDERGRVLASAGTPPAGLGAFGAAEREAIWRGVLATGQPVSVSEHELRAHAVPVVTDHSAARVVEVWKSYDRTAETFVPFVKVLPFAVPVGLVLAIVGSYLLARSALAPVGAIVRAARAIGERDLARRLPVARPRDELGQLASTFNDLLARLEVAFRQREEALAQQRRFVADASHELRTPLTSIQGYARMLRQWALDDPATARESVAAIEREAARMGLLVENLLRLARGDEDMPLERAEHDLREIARAAGEAARAAAQGKVGVVYRQPGAPVVAAFDRDRVRQVATILLDNAVKYTPEGGTVTVALHDDGCAVELSVADTGVGIPTEHLPNLFERFYRVDAARSAGGVGLGLAIARQIAEQHGGTIEVSSEVGVGSRFALRLPRGPLIPPSPPHPLRWVPGDTAPASGYPP